MIPAALLVALMMSLSVYAADTPAPAMLSVPLVDGKTDVKRCVECPADRPCAYRLSAGDSCNVCTATAYCSNGKWYATGFAQCTLLACNFRYEIANPFQNDDKK